MIDEHSAIHKAWVALEGDLGNCKHTFDDRGRLSLMLSTGFVGVIEIGDYAVGLKSEFHLDYWEEVCTVSAFEEYCKNIQAHHVEVKQENKAVFTKEMLASGDKLMAGMKFSANGENYIAEVVNDKSVCFTDNAGYLATLPLEYVRPVLSETEKLSNLILSYINVCEGIDFCHHEDKLAEFLLCEGYRKLSPEELVVYDNK